MALKCFNQLLSLAYNIPDKETKLLKSAFIGLCSEADRYFRITFGIDIYSQVDEKDFYKIKGPFPNFKKLTLEQFNRLLFTFISIRDVNAHLFLNKPIYLDDDIVEFISGIMTPKYALSINKEATIYGALCVALLFCQNYQLWTFNTQAIRHNIFSNVEKRGIVDFQRDFQAHHKPLLSLGKPIRPVDHLFFSSTDITSIIEEVKKTLTRLIFDFELNSVKTLRTSPRITNIKVLLSKYDCLKDNEELISKIVELRNLWLHGYRLFDVIYMNGAEFNFNFDYLFDVLIGIKEAFNDSKYHFILNDINECGLSMIEFYTLRSIEISYKILDSAISTPEKIKERVTNSVGAYARCMRPDESFYNNAKMLLKDEMINWFLTKSKFDDGSERIMKAERLAVFEFTSTNGFDIGDMHVSENEMVLTDIYCPLERQLKINGKYLEEYKTKIESIFGFMDIYQVEL